MIEYNTSINSNIDKIPEGYCHIKLEDTKVNGVLLDNETIRRGVNYPVGATESKIYKNGQVLRFNDLNYSTYRVYLQGNIYRVHTSRAKKSLLQCIIKRLESAEISLSSLFDEDCRTISDATISSLKDDVAGMNYINDMIFNLIKYFNINKINTLLDAGYYDYCSKFNYNTKTFVYEE